MQQPQTHFFRSAGAGLTLTVMLLCVFSCMKEKPEELPGRLEWNPVFAIPLGMDEFGLNAKSGFDTSLLEYDTISGLPKWVDEDTIFLEGTMDFDISSLLENLEHIHQILLRINISNGFPHEVYSQAYFWDVGMNSLDSLFEEGMVPTGPASIRSDGSVQSYGQTVKDAVFDHERLLALRNSNTLYFRAGFFVSDLDSVLIPYYRDFEYLVDIGAMVELDTEY